MSRPLLRSWFTVQCVVFAACATSDGGGGTVVASPPSTRHQALLEALPGDWPQRVANALPMTAAEAANLVAAVRASPNAPGAPAAIAVLGRCGQPFDDDVLIELVVDRGNLATDAALALGERAPPAAADALRHAVADVAADATLRTAAACALARMGFGAEVSPFLAAIVLAGTPAGAKAGRQFGLPVRPRWAQERYLVQRLLLRAGADELARRLDPDASWPALESLAREVQQWLQGDGARPPAR